MRERLGVAVLIAAALGGTARAQGFSDPGLGVGLQLGLSQGAGSGSDRVAIGGVHVRARLTGAIGFEGVVSVRRDVVESAGARYLELTEVPVQGSGMFFFPYTTRVQPYVLGGIGYYYVRATGTGPNASYGSKSENKFAFHGGGGVVVRVAPRLSIHADARYVFLDVDAINALRASFGLSGGGEYWEAAGGATLYF